MAYTYDNNGNLTTRIDARNITASYVYDALNRNTSVVYTDDPANTPSVTRTYDGATNGKGKLWQSRIEAAASALYFSIPVPTIAPIQLEATVATDYCA